MLNLNLRHKAKESPAGVLNIAHRGARAFAPENTLPAFGKAKSFACPMFEMDVRMTKDGELVAHHDEQLTRCTDVLVKFPGRDSYYVWDFTFAELSTLDAGSWYVEQLSLPIAERQAFLQSLTDEELARFVSLKDRQLYASGAVKLPTLQQTLALAGSLDMAVNIEIKTQPWHLSELTTAVVKQVENLQMEQQVLISSFAHEQLANVRRLSKTIATGILTSARIASLNDYLHVLDADAYHPNCYNGDAAVSSQTLNLYGFTPVREQGLWVNAWTCNNKDDMRQLIAAGATSLISDFPNRVQEVLLGA